ncbi:helicase associated domain-containing protein, partial [Streptomyces microflavus]|uniref:helicase associated domain-containing protein n=1 Tax=Streptomyces microflavus TaxID=1919 RepID=UPI0038164258
QAFERGLGALAQWVEREGADRPVPRGAVVQVAVDGEAEPVPVRLGVWISNTKARKDRLNTDQLTSLAKLGMAWAGPASAIATVPARHALQPAPPKKTHRSSV